MLIIYKKMKKIAIVANTSWNIYNFRMELARELKKNNFKVLLIAPYDEYSDKINQEFEYYNIYINRKGTNPFEDIKTTIQLYQLYKKIKPDIVLHFTIKPNIYGTIAASLLDIKIINNIAGLGTLFIKENFYTKIASFLYKYSLNKSNMIFFQNNEDFELFISKKIVSKNKCDILPGSGVDTNKFTPKKVKNNSNTFKFLLMGRMLWNKGIGEYVDAARLIKKKYSNVEFQLLGFIDKNNKNAVSKQQIQEWVDEKIINYIGSSNDVRNFIANADCIVLPSYYREGIPRTLLEAASMGKIIITTNTIGCKEVVDDGINGFLCKTKDVKDLENKMEKVLNLTEEERNKMGQAGRKKIVSKFDERVVIHKYLKAIKNLILIK
jgi:glycosyltransferase involved in cell wall biosynthesis